jgi:hypothetical protein
MESEVSTNRVSNVFDNNSRLLIDKKRTSLKRKAVREAEKNGDKIS